MNPSAAQQQTAQMVQFIISEAQDKAQEIEAKALEEFNIQKLKQVQMMKDKIRQEFAKKAQDMESKRAVAKSTAINSARLLKVQARQRCIDAACDSALSQLQSIAKSANYKQIITDLLVQGALRLLENNVVVRCRAEDKVTVSSVLSDASKKYAEILKSQGVNKTVTFKINEGRPLAPAPTETKVKTVADFIQEEKKNLAKDPKEAEKERREAAKEARRRAKVTGEATYCSGGVICETENGKIFVDNTFDARLNLMKEECKPKIRFTMFPSLLPPPVDPKLRAAVAEGRKEVEKMRQKMVIGGKFSAKK